MLTANQAGTTGSRGPGSSIQSWLPLAINPQSAREQARGGRVPVGCHEAPGPAGDGGFRHPRDLPPAQTRTVEVSASQGVDDAHRFGLEVAFHCAAFCTPE
jgi:hypothetical protein